MKIIVPDSDVEFPDRHGGIEQEPLYGAGFPYRVRPDAGAGVGTGALRDLSPSGTAEARLSQDLSKMPAVGHRTKKGEARCRASSLNVTEDIDATS